RVRYDLRRGAAALRRIALRLRQPVPRVDGEARRGRDRGTLAGHLDRAEDRRPQPALHRRDDHRGLRLPAPPVGAARHTPLAQVPKLNRRQNHDIAVVVDRLVVRRADRSRLADSIETALKAADGTVEVVRGATSTLFSERYACPACGLSLPELEPRQFSFNSPFGACPLRSPL